MRPFLVAALLGGLSLGCKTETRPPAGSPEPPPTPVNVGPLSQNVLLGLTGIKTTPRPALLTTGAAVAACAPWKPLSKALARHLATPGTDAAQAGLALRALASCPVPEAALAADALPTDRVLPLLRLARALVNGEPKQGYLTLVLVADLPRGVGLLGARSAGALANMWLDSFWTGAVPVSDDLKALIDATLKHAVPAAPINEIENLGTAAGILSALAPHDALTPWSSWLTPTARALIDASPHEAAAALQARDNDDRALTVQLIGQSWAKSLASVEAHGGETQKHLSYYIKAMMRLEATKAAIGSSVGCGLADGAQAEQAGDGWTLSWSRTGGSLAVVFRVGAQEQSKSDVPRGRLCPP